MGKVTLYHPVSLHVIRGAAEYCGWKFGKLKQYASPIGGGRARYTAEIVLMPKKIRAQSTMIMQNELQKCFMDDVRCHWMRQSKTGKWLVDLQIDINDHVDHQDGSNIEREIPLDAIEPEASLPGGGGGGNDDCGCNATDDKIEALTDRVFVYKQAIATIDDMRHTLAAMPFSDVGIMKLINDMRDYMQVLEGHRDTAEFELSLIKAQRPS